MHDYGGLVTRSEGRLKENEAELLTHVSMWGSEAYPIRKLDGGRYWAWGPIFGVNGPPTVFKTKRAASESFEAYLDVLRDKLAGRGDWA